MPKTKKHSHPTQPSWTGPRPNTDGAKNTSEKRLQGWLCRADAKGVPLGGGESFTENINWRIFRIMAEFVEGFEFLSHLQKEVSVFGSTRVSAGSHDYKMAQDLGFQCGKAGFTIVTGGGPGIMEAANRGASEAGAESVGLDISLPHEQRRNSYIKKAIGFHYFFTRKVMLSASAQAYVFFPGGFGTLDELFEIVTLIQTEKMSTEVPVILIGRAYWEPLLKWVKESLRDENKFISGDDFKILQPVDTVKEAVAIIKKTHTRVL
ncbi:MAG: TIGR00730 family Rossman fold protein [Candidatus Uhrbacteria bacterium]|nr:TIGR00730 family Rossman fold protein [Candidatus Uhrbacteria bacterium]